MKRHGVSVTATPSPFEAVPGGFPAIYPVLRALEEAGRIRRGYFVTGLGGLQFAEPGALEALRGARDPDPDGAAGRGAGRGQIPRTPYGAALPWPEAAETGTTRAPRLACRAARTHVVLVDGSLAATAQPRAVARSRRFSRTMRPRATASARRRRRRSCAGV